VAMQPKAAPDSLAHHRRGANLIIRRCQQHEGTANLFKGMEILSGSVARVWGPCPDA
jgi:hypothetical protein